MVTITTSNIKDPTGGSVPISVKESMLKKQRISTGGYVPSSIKEREISTSIQPTKIMPSQISPKMFDKMNVNEQQKTILQTYGTDKTTQVYRAMVGQIGVIPHVKLQYQTQRTLNYFKEHNIDPSKATKEQHLSAIRYILYEDAVDPIGAQERALASMDPYQRAIETAGKSFVQMGYGIASFPEFIAEEVGGRVYHGVTKGKWNEPISAPSWSPRGYYEKEVAPAFTGPQGGVGTAFSVATREYEKKTGDWTPEKESQYQSQLRMMQRYPGTAAAATFGELLSAKGTTSSIQVGKTYVGKGTSGFIKATTGKDIAPASLKPTNVISEVTSRIRQSIGLEKEIKPESYFHKGALEGKTTYGQAPFEKGIKAFRETKTKGLRPGEYTVSHTAPSPLELVTGRVKVKGSTSESPALSTSPFGRAIPQFLKVEPSDTYSYRYSILPKISKPTSPTIILKEIYRLPKNVRESYKRSAEYMKEQPRGSYGVIVPKAEIGKGGLVEPEVGIWKGTKLVRTKKNIEIPESIIRQRKVYIDLGKGKTPRLSTTYKGVRVPVPIYEAIGEGKPKGSISIGGRFKTGISKTFIEKPGEISEPYFRASYIKPSFISSKTYRSSIRKPSYTSIVSYPKPISRLSYPSKPSYPSYPSKPSYPSYPSTPSYPSYPSKPSKPSYSMPSKPSYPSYPSKPSKPSTISKPLYYVPSKKTTSRTPKKKYKLSDVEKYRERKFYIRPIYGGLLLNNKGGKK